mmetsp:Transcript_7053/g.19900  ORF Transcript_7053/g.19900 Transcript_7053/m.19900 type:complete len:247 (+) Transcript_7053:5255-5995(+)
MLAVRGLLLGTARQKNKRCPPLLPRCPPQGLKLPGKKVLPQRPLSLLLQPTLQSTARTGLLLGTARPRKRLPLLGPRRLPQSLRLLRKQPPPQRALRLLQWTLPRRISLPPLSPQRPLSLLFQPPLPRRMMRSLPPGTARPRKRRPPLQSRRPPQGVWLPRNHLLPQRPLQPLLQPPPPRRMMRRLLLMIATPRKLRAPLEPRRPPQRVWLPRNNVLPQRPLRLLQPPLPRRVLRSLLRGTGRPRN